MSFEIRNRISQLFAPRIKVIQDVLDSGFYSLKFPKELEQEFMARRGNEAAIAFRYRYIFIFFLYLLLSTGIYTLMPEQDINRWLFYYGWVGAIILAAGVLSRFDKLNHYFRIYAGLGSCLAIAISVAITGVMDHQLAGQLTQAAIMYAVFIVYGIVGLSFRAATIAGWSAGVVAVVMANWWGGSIDWAVTHRTYTGGSLLGMLVCYLVEYSQRHAFLQEKMLGLVQARTEEYANQLDLLSRVDPLTSLANRRQMEEFLDGLWRRCYRRQAPLAALMIDIDYFKHYNDGFGHVQGDECLRQIATVVGGHAGRADDLAARYGGEEFLILLGDADQQAAGKLAEQLLEAVRQLGIELPPNIGNGTISVSIGVATLVPDASVTPAMLLEKADEALYQAKQSGRDRVVLASMSQERRSPAETLAVN